ncbi:hypothetical protein CPC08DRAFT_761351 [Agrocybe pediades]|nr:hypothetical protein CPC08DRAFT_761351 [Agrocybe pediades]
MPLAPAEIADGPMLIGFTFNAILLGVMLTQAYIYFTSFKKDKIWIKLYVALLMVLDVFNTAAIAVFIYQALILNFGNLGNLDFVSPIIITEPAITGFIVSAVQCFYAWRIYVLTKSYTFPILIILNGITGLVASLVTAARLGKTPRFSDIVNDKPSITVWLVSEVLGDILITIVLVTYFANAFSVTVTIQTGMLTATFATIDLITFLADPTGLHLLFNFALAKLYSNTLMSTLNSREIWMSDSPGVSSRSTIGGGGLRTQDEVVSMSAYKSSAPKPSEVIDFNKRTEVFVSVERDANGRVRDGSRVDLEAGRHPYGDVKGSYP